ncbi:hypothetical protein XSR1_280042 [Xenorhabdus szentirmaii DSM 16338]|uniref:Uncharacterized protein n=1 Tax=Xenorhabdus szentirmaii DSM 16338 TaxID=1427518 RepID=W1J0S8_9GAMM|nr:hypothetical protein XSR1_280042 [Xenorhabdus szentirmaii DSM 16338]
MCASVVINKGDRIMLSVIDKYAKVSKPNPIISNKIITLGMSANDRIPFDEFIFIFYLATCNDLLKTID